MTDLKKMRRGGFYFINKKPYLSVTKILSVISKPQLQYWFGKQVYLAMVADPTLSEHDALSSPYKISEKAMNRGTTVHSIVEVFKEGKINAEKWIEGLDPKWQGYATAFYKWITELEIKIIAHEKTIVNKEQGYAGTMDLLVKINGDKYLSVVDVKTGRDIYPDYALQLSAYKEAVQQEDKIFIKQTIILLLKEDGTYKFEIMSDEYKAFLAAKTLYEGINREELLKVGYLNP